MKTKKKKRSYQRYGCFNPPSMRTGIHRNYRLGVVGGDQARCPIGGSLGQKQGRISVLNRCFWGRKERFKEFPGKKIGNWGYGWQITREIDNLWVFFDHGGVEPTNNRAERALRFGVLWRKRSLGTQSKKGNRWVKWTLWTEWRV